MSACFETIRFNWMLAKRHAPHGSSITLRTSWEIWWDYTDMLWILCEISF